MSGLVSGFGVNKYPKGINGNHNLWLLSIFLLKFGYSEKATKFEKNLPLKIVWPSQNIRTLTDNVASIKAAKVQKFFIPP